MKGGIILKKTIRDLKKPENEDSKQVDFDEYAEMFEEGYSDEEISSEFGDSENFIKKLREEYQKDY